MRLRDRQLTVGSWITLGHPAIAEIMAGAGFDWAVVDLEHSTISIREAGELIRVLELSSTPALVRLSSNDPAQVKRVMDAGATGVVVPMVNTRQEAQRAVESVYYPPVGKRGVGLARAQGYGASFHEYREGLKDNAVVIVQIEHIEAVGNLADILSVEGVDGFIVGPYDLSGSLGVPGQFDHPGMVEALAEIKAVSRTSAKVPGIHVVEPDNAAFQRAVADGYRFVAYSVDIRMLDAACRARPRPAPSGGPA